MGGDGLALVVLRPGHLHGHLAVLGGKAHVLPHLLHHVGGKGAEQQAEHLHVALGAAIGVELVDHGHHGGDSGVHLQLVDILADLLDGLVDDGLVLGGDGLLSGGDILQIEAAVQEALAALDSLVAPADGLLEVADEHDVQAHGVRAVLGYDVVGVDHVAAGLGHLLAALAQDHAVAGALGVGLLGGHHADVVKREYSRCSVVCSMPPLYQSTGDQ